MKNEFEQIIGVVMRAERMGIDSGDRMTNILDVEHAKAQFNIDMAAWLAADDMNFAHDFCGIQRHIDRRTGKMGDYFIPRFAGNE